MYNEMKEERERKRKIDTINKFDDAQETRNMHVISTREQQQKCCNSSHLIIDDIYVTYIQSRTNNNAINKRAHRSQPHSIFD